MHTNNHCRVRIAHLHHHQVDACEAVARALPAWLVIEEGLRDLRTCLETRAGGAALLHVKTLADAHPSPEYADARAFIAAMGLVLPEH